jgi:hypothetical protein
LESNVTAGMDPSYIRFGLLWTRIFMFCFQKNMHKIE